MKKISILLTLLIAHLILFGQAQFMDKELDPDRFNTNFSAYDQNTALFSGQLSDLVYNKPKEIEKTIRDLREKYPEWKLSHKFLENKKNSVQALLLCTKDFMIIAFRGTEPSVISDWTTNGSYWNYENNQSGAEQLANMPPGHGGFRRSLMSLMNEENLFKEIDQLIHNNNSNVKISDFPIYLTGHSLGAALSQLFMECLRFKEYNFKGAYHFAPPLAVSCTWREQMKQNFGTMVYDIVNYKDYVPRAGRNGVAHFGQFIRICTDELLYFEKEAYVKFSIGEYAQVLKYHSLINHLAAIRREDNKLSNILSRLSNFSCLGEEIKAPDPCK